LRRAAYAEPYRRKAAIRLKNVKELANVKFRDEGAAAVFKNENGEVGSVV